MASRKAKPREKKRASTPDVEDAARIADRPSSSMTVEVEALSVKDLLSAARTSARNLPPAPPTTVRSLDDLAATVEVPSLSAAGPRVLIMDAAEAVIADRGYHHTTIREVSEWAGVSIDVFHAHFADMRALLGALCERFSELAMNVIDDATRPSRWDDAEGASLPLEYAVRSVVELMLGRMALLRAIMSSPDRPLVDEVRRIGTHLTIRLTRLASGLPHLTSHPDPHDIGFAVLSAIALAHHAATVGTAWSGVELDREDLAKRAANMAVAYVESALSSSRRR